MARFFHVLIFFTKLILKALLIVWTTTSKISQNNFSYKDKLCFYLCFINLNKTIHKLLSIVVSVESALFAIFSRSNTR